MGAHQTIFAKSDESEAEQSEISVRNISGTENYENDQADQKGQKGRNDQNGQNEQNGQDDQKGQKAKTNRKIAMDPKNYELSLLHHFAMAKDVGATQHEIDMAEFLFSYVEKRKPLEIKYRNLCIMMGLERKPFKYIDMSGDYSAEIPANMIIIKEYIDKKQTICDLQAEIDKMIANYDADQRIVAE